MERSAPTYQLVSWKEVLQHAKLLAGEKCSNISTCLSKKSAPNSIKINCFESIFELRERMLEPNLNIVDLIFIISSKILNIIAFKVVVFQFLK